MLSLMEAGAAALFLAIVFTPVLIRSLRVGAIGQQIHEDVPRRHVVKAGTPTRVARSSCSAAIFGYLIGHLGGYRTFTRSGVLVLALVVACGVIGFADDLIGVRNARNLGLNKRTKFAAQVRRRARLRGRRVEVGGRDDDDLVHPLRPARLAPRRRSCGSSSPPSSWSRPRTP